MSLTLGEKLRQAREERGITLSEVAEQTRISPMYIESIENDDFRTLPGGIFNKGFVKSFAKYVGVNEQEALMDYSRLIAATESDPEPDLKVYRPEVLTDDRSGSSMVPTVIVAVIILAAMTAGILFLVNYLRRPAEPLVANTATKPNVNANAETPANTETPASDVPDMATLKIEFVALNAPVPLSVVADGAKADKNVTTVASAIFEPKESLTVNYNKWNADKLQMTINGKLIALPAGPLDPKAKRIEFTISKDNLAKIWSSGSITGEAATAADANINSNANSITQRPTPSPTPAATATPAPATPTSTVPTPTMKSQPTPRSTVITVPPRPGRTP